LGLARAENRDAEDGERGERRREGEKTATARPGALPRAHADEETFAEGGGRLERRSGEGERRNRGARLGEPLPAVGASGGEVRLERPPVGGLERSEGVEGVEVLVEGAAHRSPPSPCGSAARRRRSAFRARPLTVPRGVPVRSAI